MSMSNSMPPRPTLLTTAALAGTASEAPPAPVSANPGNGNPQASDATTLIFFYVFLGFIMISLIFGLFPQ